MVPGSGAAAAGSQRLEAERRGRARAVPLLHRAAPADAQGAARLREESQGRSNNEIFVLFFLLFFNF